MTTTKENSNPSSDSKSEAHSFSDGFSKAKEGFSQAKTAVEDFLENDPKAQATELGKKLADEATVFIKDNPWASVFGAAVIGYLIGSTRGGRK